jgi:hypothetical protein
MSSLNKLARAFDIDLRVAFEAFSIGILDVVNLRKETIEVPPREGDLASFSAHILRTNRDGAWTLIDRSRLASVVPMPSPTPATPSQNWTPLSATGR